ncbi:MAG: hypothetical protein D6790_04935 [Caldilineae bacterium]|nr:MAG: hypothetical protein D6790_04935 [Caldilineae bacterium]
MLFLYILLTALGLFLIARIMTWYLERVTYNAVTRHFQAAEYILAHHRAPPAWRRPPLLLRLRPGSTQRQAKERLIRRLDALIAYFEASPMVKDEETRRTLLGQLQKERIQWVVRPLDEIC